MQIEWARLDDFKGGWFIGAFSPSVHATSEFEACVKRYQRGESEPEHYQRMATEVTVIISGLCEVAGRRMIANDIAVIPPGVSAGFRAIEETVLVAVKFPSLPDDKVVGRA